MYTSSYIELIQGSFLNTSVYIYRDSNLVLFGLNAQRIVYLATQSRYLQACKMGVDFNLSLCVV